MKNFLLKFKRRAPLLAACTLSALLLMSAYWLRNVKIASMFSHQKPAATHSPLKTAPPAPSFHPPALGKVVMDFKENELVLNPVTLIYETHPGTDYACPDHCVYAVSDGRVQKIYKDDRLGLTVRIIHADGGVSVYASLSECLVKENETVKKGEIIARPGVSAPFESQTRPHVHFEYIKNGVQTQIPFTEQGKP